MDGINPLGRTRDVEIIGRGKSDMDDRAASAAAAQGRVAVPDAHPERGSFFRADQFEFARVGVPGLYISNGLDFIGQPPDYGETKRSEFIAKRYHQVGDVIQADWTLEGGAQDVQLLWRGGVEVGNRTPFSQRKGGGEFKGPRDPPRPRHPAPGPPPGGALAPPPQNASSPGYPTARGGVGARQKKNK